MAVAVEGSLIASMALAQGRKVSVPKVARPTSCNASHADPATPDSHPDCRCHLAAFRSCRRIHAVHWIVKSMHLKHAPFDARCALSDLSDTVTAGSTSSITNGGVK